MLATIENALGFLEELGTGEPRASVISQGGDNTEPTRGVDVAGGAHAEADYLS